jgi:hypothetical protein
LWIGRPAGASAGLNFLTESAAGEAQG